MVKTTFTGDKRSSNQTEEESFTVETTTESTMTQETEASHLSFQLTSHKLNSKNYLEWSLSVKLAIDGCGKLGHLNGEVEQAQVGDPNMSKWRLENSMTIAWLINSMEASVEFDEVRSQILGKKPLPKLRKIFSKVRREETRRKVMLKPGFKANDDNSALVAIKNNDDSEKKKKPWCDYCKKYWHTRETCWKLHGKPTGKKSGNGCGSQSGDSRAFQTTNGNYEGQSSLERSPFTKEQLEHLHKFFQSPQFRMNYFICNSSNNPSSSFAQSGNKKIKVADRSFLEIAGKGTVKISSSLVLHDVLHDMVSGRMIGNAKEFGGIYFLEYDHLSQPTTILCLNFVSDFDKIYPSEFLGVVFLFIFTTKGGNYTKEDSIIDQEKTRNIQHRDSNNREEEIEIKKVESTRFITKNPTRKILLKVQVLEWKKAILEEMRALEKIGTWEIMELPVGKKIVGCKWVFTTKFKPDGSLDRYKARLVAKGYTQTYRRDYLETFAPVAKLNFVRVLLSIDVNLDWSLQQLDVKNAFLNGKLEEEVYMDPPPGFEEKIGTRASQGVSAFEFEIQNLGPLKYFLGMEVARSRKGLVASQKKYVIDLLKEAGMSGCRPADTPIDPNVKFENKEGQLVDKGQYQRLVGKLIYLSHTRPDIAFAVSLVSQFMHSPMEEHEEVVFRILRYLKSSPRKGLFFKKSEQRGIEAYTDADWAGSITDRRSTSGYCTFVWGNLVTWRSKKQSVVARSSAEAEFRSMAQGICEMMWLKRIMEELRKPITSPMKLYYDSKAAISIAHNPVQHDKTKHVEIDKHFIKEKIKESQVCMRLFLQNNRLLTYSSKDSLRQAFIFL
ncbi:hypothetical protein CXB51_006239 [Gossypium anomalum]|uniref:Retrovirus-related Pol polyprotein from transposon RE1 n=1 Tax=Gossypium anomalum TaxID=47600 RepID=A0A8J6DCL0_9ROSI|nr:hypothetical protein CXB51_006239 [Gossypium anomalum]